MNTTFNHTTAYWNGSSYSYNDCGYSSGCGPIIASNRRSATFYHNQTSYSTINCAFLYT